MSALAQPQPADPPAPPPRVPRPRRAPAVRSTLHTARMGVTLAGGPHAEFKARAAVDYRLAVRFPLAATAEQVLKRFGQLVSVPYPAHYYSELWFADAALAPDVRLVDLLDLPYGGVLEVRERRHEIKVGELPQRKHYVADVHPAAHRLQRARDEASSNRSTRFVDEMRRLRKEAQEVAPGGPAVERSIYAQRGYPVTLVAEHGGTSAPVAANSALLRRNNEYFSTLLPEALPSTEEEGAEKGEPAAKRFRLERGRGGGGGRKDGRPVALAATRIVVNGVTPRTLRDIVRYLETGRATFHGDAAGLVELCYACHAVGCTEYLADAAVRLLPLVVPENAVDLWTVAWRVDAGHLARFCRMFVALQLVARNGDYAPAFRILAAVVPEDREPVEEEEKMHAELEAELQGVWSFNARCPVDPQPDTIL